MNAGVGAPYAVPNETDTSPFAGGNSDTYAGKPPLGPDEASFNKCAVPNTGAQAGTYNNLACAAPNSNDPAYASYTADAVVALAGSLNSYYAGQQTLTFASLPLSFMGKNISSIVSQDAHPALDLSDVQHDIRTIAKNNPAVSWGWYQQGFGAEPFDGSYVVDSFPTSTPHPSYIVHHNGPQYFGYLGDNPAELANMHGLQQFYTDISNNALPAGGGVFYVRGGYYNNDGLQTNDPSPAVRTLFNGNDDHGSYSDSQISEAMVADTVNAIANSPYWANSAIIISYDESDGYYDHTPEAIRNWGPDTLPMSGGPRIPTVVLSPFSTAHTVDHVYDEHGSIVSLINKIFGLTPLANLPDERRAQALGATEFTSPNGSPQTELAPDDTKGVGNMLEAFDNDRLLGKLAPIPASAVTISANIVHTLPHYAGAGCSALNITPTDYPNGYGAGWRTIRRRKTSILARPSRPVFPISNRQSSAATSPIPGRHRGSQSVVRGLRAGFIISGALLLQALVLSGAWAADQLRCGVISEPLDWNKQDLHGSLVSLDTEMCGAVAAAVFGAADRVVCKVTIPSRTDLPPSRTARATLSRVSRPPQVRQLKLACISARPFSWTAKASWFIARRAFTPFRT